MTPKWMEIFKDEIDERVETAKDEEHEKIIVSNLKKLMDKLKITLNNAMDLLDIPQNEREKYIGMLEK